MNYKKMWQDRLLRQLRQQDTVEVSTREARVLGYVTELEEEGKIEVVSRESGVLVLVLRLKRADSSARP